MLEAEHKRRTLQKQLEKLHKEGVSKEQTESMVQQLELALDGHINN